MRHREEWIRAVNTIPSISLTTCVILPWGREGRGDVTPSPQPLCSSGTGAKPFCDSGLDAWCWVLGAGIGCWVLINFPPSRKPGGGSFLPEAPARCRLALQQTSCVMLVLLYKIPSESGEMGF